MQRRRTSNRTIEAASTAVIKTSKLGQVFNDTMIPEPYALFDIDRGSDKFFLIGTTWIILFLFLL